MFWQMNEEYHSTKPVLVHTFCIKSRLLRLRAGCKKDPTSCEKFSRLGALGCLLPKYALDLTGFHNVPEPRVNRMPF